MNLHAAMLTEHFEGFRSKPYLCSAGVATIGLGTTRYPDGTKVTMQDPPVSLEQAREWQWEEIQRIQTALAKLCPGLDYYREAAVISWVYNFGLTRLKASTMLRRLKEQKWDEAAEECRKWIYSAGKPSKGLLRRRLVEAHMIETNTMEIK